MIISEHVVVESSNNITETNTYINIKLIYQLQIYDIIVKQEAVNKVSSYIKRCLKSKNKVPTINYLVPFSSIYVVCQITR